MSAGTLPSTRRVVLADVPAASRTRDVVLVVAYAVAIALTAQVAVPLPFSPVPVTGQTFAVLLGAAALGPARAASGATLYLAAGVAGLPWFAASSGATVGYLVGFVLAGMLVGRWARAGADRTAIQSVALMAAGNAVIYTLGVAGLLVVADMSVTAAITAGVVPFLVGDALKIAAAAALLPATWRRVDGSHRA